MAKSLRSKRKQDNKIIKRQTVFGEAAAAREKRIAERLHKAAIDDIIAKQEENARPVESMEVENAAEAPSSTASAAPVPGTSKKSTGGWSRRKKVKGKKGKKSRK